LKPLGKTSNVSEVMKALQQELHDIFGYDVELKDVSVPVWKLIVTSSAVPSKVRSDDGGYYYYESPTGFTVRNFPAEKLLRLVVRYISNKYTIFVDETGLAGNIDLEVDALMTDWDELRKGLRGKGFDLIRGTRTMKVLVISDRKISKGS